MNVVVILFEAARPPADMAVILEWLAGRAAGGDSCHVAELRGVARTPVEVDGVTFHRGSAHAPGVAASAELLVVTHPEGLGLAADGVEVWDACDGFKPPTPPKAAPKKRAA